MVYCNDIVWEMNVMIELRVKRLKNVLNYFLKVEYHNTAMYVSWVAGEVLCFVYHMARVGRYKTQVTGHKL